MPPQGLQSGSLEEEEVLRGVPRIPTILKCLYLSSDSTNFENSFCWLWLY